MVRSLPTAQSTTTAGRAVTKAGGGTVLLQAPVTATAVNVQGGTLQLGSGGAVLGSVALTIQAGATFENATGSPITIGSLAGYGTLAIGTRDLIIGSGNAASTFNGSITGTGVVTKVGTNRVHFSYSSTVTNPVEIQAGRVSFTDPSLTGGPVLLNPVNVNDSAELDPVGPSKRPTRD